MKTIDICVNCICLAVCMHKNYTTTARDCVFIRSVFVEAAKNVMFGDDINIHFLGIDKIYFVNCDSSNISVGKTVDNDIVSRQKYYLFNYPHEHIVDADLNVKGFFPHI